MRIASGIAIGSSVFCRVFGRVATALLCLVAGGALPSLARGAAILPGDLESEISARLPRVEEFRFLRETCEALKVRCWLFGGTAAGYGHYVKWDLLREAGDVRFQPDRFDYDYTNIFRSTQDADIVVDGAAAQADALERALKEKYGHLQGSKDVWEVRLLNESRGDKEALLHNPDFLNQHTDSNSTGMIELTRPAAGESAVRDLRDWTPAEKGRPHFLKDIHEGKLHYYYSELHGATARAKAGTNPPILSAIRFLTKAFQYELEVRPEDWARLARVIDGFDPARDLSDSYVQRWVEKNGKKLFQHAVNLEYAWNTVEKLGLRRKLLATGDVAAADTLAHWMNREPLRTAPLGSSGRTAAEVFREKGWNDLVVAHETRDFLAYESITRAHTGDPNVLISRELANGEAALYGDGFYTRVGREGAAGTGLTIRFRLDPAAREGKDFIVAADDYIVVRNKRALRVIPESLNLDPQGFVKLLLSEAQFSGDRGIFEKLKRRIGPKLRNLSAADSAEIVTLIRAAARSEAPRIHGLLEVLQLEGIAARAPLAPVDWAGLKLRVSPTLPNELGERIGKHLTESLDALPGRARSAQEGAIVKLLREELDSPAPRSFQLIEALGLPALKTVDKRLDLRAPELFRLLASGGDGPRGDWDFTHALRERAAKALKEATPAEVAEVARVLKGRLAAENVSLWAGYQLAATPGLERQALLRPHLRDWLASLLNKLDTPQLGLPGEMIADWASRILGNPALRPVAEEAGWGRLFEAKGGAAGRMVRAFSRDGTLSVLPPRYVEKLLDASAGTDPLDQALVYLFDRSEWTDEPLMQRIFHHVVRPGTTPPTYAERLLGDYLTDRERWVRRPESVKYLRALAERGALESSAVSNLLGGQSAWVESPRYAEIVEIVAKVPGREIAAELALRKYALQVPRLSELCGGEPHTLERLLAGVRKTMPPALSAQSCAGRGVARLLGGASVE